MSSRRKQRELAFKLMYAETFNKGSIHDTIAHLAEEGEIKEADYSDFVKLLIKTVENESDLFNDLIKSKLKNWDLDRVNLVDKLLIKLALAEFTKVLDVAAEITLNEAVELAKKYGTDDSQKFVNAILDKLFKELIDDKKVFKKFK